jgi:hypothetical protein
VSATSATAGPHKTITLDDLQRTLRDLGAIPRETKWILVDPNGNAFKAEPEELIKILIPHHPFMASFDLFKETKL